VGDRLWTGKPPRRGTRHAGLLSLSLPSVQAGMSTWRQLGESTGISHDTPARVHGLAVFAECLAGGWLAEISADLREVVAHWRRVRDDALYKLPHLLYCTLPQL